jgi:Na+/H+ antiporter NhaC
MKDYIKSSILLCLVLFAFLNGNTVKAENKLFNDTELVFPDIIIQGSEKTIEIDLKEPVDTAITVYINNNPHLLSFANGKGSFNYIFTKKEDISFAFAELTIRKTVNPIPLWLSILPPLLAIFMALLFREVVTSLFVGIFSGALIIFLYRDGLYGIPAAFLSVLDTYIINALKDPDHLAVILFSMLIGSMVTIISKNGGMKGVVDKLSKHALSPKSGQLTTWLLGVLIFFDDYANTLVVGNTMRPVTDKLKISREKLSYLVDSTAAPIAAIAFVTTWIGAQLGYIKDSIVGIDGLNESAYSVFINSLQYAFYPVFTLAFMLMLIFKNRDFGPMHRAELRARKDENLHNSHATGAVHEEISALEPKIGISSKAFNAIIPVLFVIFGTMAGLVYTGFMNTGVEMWSNEDLSFARKISNVIGNADSYTSLLWASFGGVTIAFLLSVSQRLLTVSETVNSMVSGFKTMLTAIIILVLAWSLASVTEHLHTADFITGILLSLKMNPVLLPATTFILAALVAFSTGSSWGTMAILYPLMLPASWLLSVEQGLSPELTLIIFYNVVSTVLAGSVLGDHCSPISDTTILSSLATSCNHIDHVRTQLPYALTVGVVAIIAGTIPGAMGVPSYITMPVGILILFLIVHFVGKKVD